MQACVHWVNIFPQLCFHKISPTFGTTLPIRASRRSRSRDSHARHREMKSQDSHSSHRSRSYDYHSSRRSKSRDSWLQRHDSLATCRSTLNDPQSSCRVSKSRDSPRNHGPSHHQSRSQHGPPCSQINCPNSWRDIIAHDGPRGIPSPLAFIKYLWHSGQNYHITDAIIL